MARNAVQIGRCQSIRSDAGNLMESGGGGVNCRIIYWGGQSVSNARNVMDLKERYKLQGNVKKRSVH